MNKLLDFVCKIFYALEFVFDGKHIPSNSVKELLPPQDLVDYKGNDSILDDDGVLLLNKLVKIKRELNAEVPPDDRTNKIIAYIFNETIPGLFEENFHNGENELYISHVKVCLKDEHYFVDENDFRKAIPYCVIKLEKLNIKSRVSSNMLIIKRSDLMKLVEDNDLQPLETVERKMNSVGIYR